MASSHASAVAHTLKALKSLGRIEDVDIALLNAWERLAEEIDADDTKDRAGLYREFRAYDAKVREVTGADDVDDRLTDLLARISGPGGGDTSKT